MKKQFTTQRKWSAIVALTLAVVVTFMAAIKSFGTTNAEELIVYDIKGSLERAYEEVIEDKYEFEEVESNIETIKIFDKNDRLILSIVKEIDGAIEDEKAQILLNRADYLSSFAGTSIYKIEE
ncbi:hypothetical protein [uncultured Roseivirga sp.]|uniref:hypothetical protein n=1 Tax=uncultured Roseivirga sp. TaxID=543088 RepID=UPI000D7B074B|nr:hypothetical protein [uncultured Roseivirga sp.]PWL24410.1 MAG: hypothetical protein DCO95_18955 [Roseivirga sp. XM-24bin3]